MKKTFILLTAMLMLCSCGGRKDVSVTELASELSTGVSYAETLTELEDTGAERRLFLNPGDYSDIDMYIGTKAVCDEIAVIKTLDTENVISKLNAHIDQLKQSYSDYRPSELQKLENAYIGKYRDTVVLIITDDIERAKAVYTAYLKG